MQYQKTLRLFLALLLLSSGAFAQSMPKPVAPAADVERLRAHVGYLASEKLEGRRTGTEGAREAARYVAREFIRAGLSPGAGVSCGELTEACYMQQFPYVAGVELGNSNTLTATRRADAGVPLAIDFKVGEDWMPLGFGSSGKAEGPVAFVGYGITAAEQGHDDYKGAGAAGKVALAFAGTPDGDNPHGRFTRAGELRFKAAAARAAGAKALVVIAGEEDFKKDRLARLRYDNAGGDAGLPVAVISRQAAAKVLGLLGPPLLAEFERSLRGGGGGGPVAVIQDAELGRGVVLSLSADVVRKNAPAANVVGVLEGSDAKLKSEVIVLGAHYDHLGRGGEGSGSLGREGDIHYGADDNASGTAGLLELARLLASEKERMRRTVVFVAFGGEEEGLLGSGHYVQNPARPLEQTVAMLNMDMVGRLRNGALYVGGVGTAAELRAMVEGVNMVHLPPVVVTGKDGRKEETPAPWVRRFELRLSEDGFGPSDHSSFYARRVPVLFFFTGVHEDYHKPTDTADRVNYHGEAQILELVRDIVMSLQSRDARPTYAAAKSEGGTRTTFRVSLGVMPSYGESTDGLRLDSVREGSPAAAAGVKAGDRVVKLAGRDIRNVYDYTQALSEMKAGQEYEIELIRDGQRLKLKVTPAERK